jgi:ATP/maltotriose-dependent transcriptional regulator MalT
MNSSGEPDVDPLRLIVKPKLRAPARRHEQVIRPRLLELLGNAGNRRITLVGAPAGYGKTTLLAQ